MTMSNLGERPHTHWVPGDALATLQAAETYMEHSLLHDNGDPLDRCWCELSGCPEHLGPECRCHRIGPKPSAISVLPGPL